MTDGIKKITTGLRKNYARVLHILHIPKQSDLTDITTKVILFTDNITAFVCKM